MAIEPFEFLELKSISDNSRMEEQHWLDRHMPPRIVSREYSAVFHYSIEEAYIVRHFTRDCEPIQYDRDGVRFQFIARNLASVYLQDPNHPDDPNRKILVGTIDALIVPAPDGSLYTVRIPEAVK